MRTTALKAKITPDMEAQIRADVSQLADRFTTRRELSRETASLLFFRYGIYPSAQLVREYTKLGSMGDIGADLDEFWKDIREKSRVRIEAGGLPEDVLLLGGELVMKLYELARQEAKKELEAFRQEARDQVAEAQRQAQEAEQLRQLAVSRANAAEEDAKAAHADREEAERLLAVEQADKEAALATARQWENQAKLEAENREKAERQFSADLHAEREARRQSEEYLHGEVKFVKMQIEAARSTERDLRDRIKAVEADKTIMEATLRKQANALSDENGRLRLEIGELRGKLDTIAAERDRLTSQVAELMERIELDAGEKVRQARRRARQAMKQQALSMPTIFELVDMLDCNVVIDADPESPEDDQVFLGTSGQGDAPGWRATPSFKSVEALEAFCKEHVERYRGLDVDRNGIPEKWFWQEDESGDGESSWP